MALWQVRSGKSADYQDIARSQKIIFVDWKVPDLSNVATIEEMKTIFHRAYKESKDKTILNWSHQMWSFAKGIAIGDYVIFPDKRKELYMFGAVESDYQYMIDLSTLALHARSVRWLSTDIKRSRIDRDILASLGSIMTVSRIFRNNAEERLKQLILGMGSKG